MTEELRLARVIDAPPEVVFEAFTTAGGQVAFYGQDDAGWIVESQCDLRVGGAWTITFGPSRSLLSRHRHVFEVIERPRRLVLATTEFRADGSSFDFAMQVTFQEQDGRTRSLASNAPSTRARETRQGSIAPLSLGPQPQSYRPPRRESADRPTARSAARGSSPRPPTPRISG